MVSFLLTVLDYACHIGGFLFFAFTAHEIITDLYAAAKNRIDLRRIGE